MSDTIVVVGLGRVGGSVARALRALPDAPRVLGVDPDPIQGEQARQAGVVEFVDLSGEVAIPEGSLVLYATPLATTLRLLKEHRDLWHPDAWVSDVGTLQAPIHRRMTALGMEGRYVGAQPMIRGDGTGFGASGDGVLAGARVWLTASDAVSPAFRLRAEALWSSLGAEPEWIDPEEHDRQMAWVSLLPRLVSHALAGALDAAGYPRSALGPEAQQMVHLSTLDPEGEGALFEASAPALGTGLTSISRALNILADLLARREMGRIQEFTERTRRWGVEGGEG